MDSVGVRLVALRSQLLLGCSQLSDLQQMTCASKTDPPLLYHLLKLMVCCNPVSPDHHPDHICNILEVGPCTSRKMIMYLPTEYCQWDLACWRFAQQSKECVHRGALTTCLYKYSLVKLYWGHSWCSRPAFHRGLWQTRRLLESYALPVVLASTDSVVLESLIHGTPQDP